MDLNKKTLMFIIGTVIVGVLFALAYALLADDSDNAPPPNGVEQPLGYQLEQEVEIPTDITPEDLKRKYKLLKVAQDSHVDLAQEIASLNTTSSLGYSKISDTSHVWGELFGNPAQYIYYEELTDLISLRFNTPMSVEGASDPITDETSAKRVALDMLAMLVDEDYEYAINNVTITQGEYRVEASRLVDGITVELPGIAEYSDFLVLNEAGRILYGQLLLAEFEDPFTIGIVDFDDIPQLLNKSAYPANYNQGAPIGYSPRVGTLDGDHADTPGEEAAIEQSTSCVVTSAEIVYYYSTVDQLHLSPTYKLGCIGNITIDGLGFEVPVIVYTNAVDPDYVYIPSNVAQ